MGKDRQQLWEGNSTVDGVFGGHEIGMAPQEQGMDADRLRIEQAIEDVEDLNGFIINAGRSLFTATTSNEPGVPTDSDRREVVRRIKELQGRRDELEGRLIQTIEEGIGRKRTSRF
jgi:hypothetical protein